MADTIPGLMLKDHAEILVLLRTFDEGRKDSAKAVPLFDAFQWKLERHMLIEERVIFGYTSFSRESSRMIHQVLEEHKLMLGMLKSIQKELQAGSFDSDISDFKQVLDEHRLFEDRELYPKLDAELDAKAKQFMVDQLKTRIG